MRTLYYVHDPMCSWCWGFAPTLKKLLAALPNNIEVKRVLGGLAPDTEQPMPAGMQNMLQDTWRSIEAKIPNTNFNFDFWTHCQPRRATYASCRAVIAARMQGQEFDAEMTAAIQRAYYQQARNPSDLNILIELAEELGLDVKKFKKEITSVTTQQQLEKEIALSRQLYAESFPSLVLQREKSHWPIAIDYLNANPMLELINNLNEG